MIGKAGTGEASGGLEEAKSSSTGISGMTLGKERLSLLAGRKPHGGLTSGTALWPKALELAPRQNKQGLPFEGS